MISVIVESSNHFAWRYLGNDTFTANPSEESLLFSIGCQYRSNVPFQSCLIDPQRQWVVICRTEEHHRRSRCIQVERRPLSRRTAKMPSRLRKIRVAIEPLWEDLEDRSRDLRGQTFKQTLESQPRQHPNTLRVLERACWSIPMRNSWQLPKR